MLLSPTLGLLVCLLSGERRLLKCIIPAERGGNRLLLLWWANGDYSPAEQGSFPPDFVWLFDSS